MTVRGDNIIENCRECFSANGYAVKLVPQGSQLVCSYNASHRYVVQQGFLKRV